MPVSFAMLDFKSDLENLQGKHLVIERHIVATDTAYCSNRHQEKLFYYQSDYFLEQST